MLTKKGVITSAGKMKDTVTVTVHQQVLHPLYKKSYRQSKKFMADSKGMDDLAMGDEVIIQECRPISKHKHFKVTEVTKRVPRVSEMADEAKIQKAINREKVAPQSSASSDSSESSSSSSK